MQWHFFELITTNIIRNLLNFLASSTSNSSMFESVFLCLRHLGTMAVLISSVRHVSKLLRAVYRKWLCQYGVLQCWRHLAVWRSAVLNLQYQVQYYSTTTSTNGLALVHVTFYDSRLQYREDCYGMAMGIKNRRSYCWRWWKNDSETKGIKATSANSGTKQLIRDRGRL